MISPVSVLSTVTSFPNTDTMPVSSPVTVAPALPKTMEIVRAKVVLAISSSESSRTKLSVMEVSGVTGSTGVVVVPALFCPGGKPPPGPFSEKGSSSLQALQRRSSSGSCKR